MKSTKGILSNIVIIVLLLLIFALLVLISKTKNQKDYKSIFEIMGSEAINWEENLEEKFPTKLIVYVNYEKTSEIPQVITDDKIIKEVIDKIRNIKVIDKEDEVDINTMRITYYFEDDDGNNISFTFQNGMFKNFDGRYNLKGINELYNIDGIDLIYKKENKNE